MGTSAKKGSTLPISAGLSGNDYVLSIATVTSITNNYLVTITTLFSNSNVSFVTTGNNAVSTANLVVRTAPVVPANSSSVGSQGQILWDNTHIYVCIANNSWMRTTLSTF